MMHVFQMAFWIAVGAGVGTVCVVAATLTVVELTLLLVWGRPRGRK